MWDDDDDGVNLCGRFGSGVTSIFDEKVTVYAIQDVDGFSSEKKCWFGLDYYCDVYGDYCGENDFCAFPPGTGCPSGTEDMWQFNGISSLKEVYELFNGGSDLAVQTDSEMKKTQAESCAEAVEKSIAENVLTDDFYQQIQDTGNPKAKLKDTLNQCCQTFYKKYTEKLKKKVKYGTDAFTKVAEFIGKKLCSLIVDAIESRFSNGDKDKANEEFKEFMKDIITTASEEVCDEAAKYGLAGAVEDAANFLTEYGWLIAMIGGSGVVGYLWNKYCKKGGANVSAGSGNTV
ncbi:hypothetical protein TrVE_jg6998 [Triparma verrucosa]|uniref:Uncharacterized protein n=2 Tax=Triparma TaxID=722752 RepID=A0A9W7E5F0_9STRA|nr:hypothetical protein TrST_g3176 [Triparma strigata]GMH88564.1 hypothetical protein TrVE_jg6998 [Triparma verrucosa]